MERIGNITGNRPFALAMVGMVCLYTVAIALFYYDWLFELPFAVNPFLYEVALNGCLCAAACGVAALTRRGVSMRAIAVAGVAAYAACFTLLVAVLAVPSSALVYGAGACAGAGAALLVPAWFTLAGRLPGKRYGYLLGGMSLACGVTVIAVNALPFQGMVAVCAALVAASALLLRAVGAGMPCALAAHGEGEASDGGSLGNAEGAPAPAQDGPAALTDSVREASTPFSGRAASPAAASAAGRVAPERGASFEGKPWGALVMPLVYVLFLSVIYGALDEAASIALPVPQDWAGVIYQVGGAVADVLFLLYVRFGRRNYAALFNVVLCVIATGLLFLPFLPATYGFALLVFTHTGWGLALLVSYALAIELFRGGARRLFAASAIVFAFPRPGVVLGSGVAAAIGAGGQFAFVQTTMLAFVLLYVIMAGVWFIRTREKRAADRAIRHRDELIKRYARAREDMLAMVCEDIAAECGLTKREAEMLNLFARGRDAAYVEGVLFLSRNTVKSYSKSLYAKLSVHSRQDLIDMVEARFPQFTR